MNSNSNYVMVTNEDILKSLSGMQSPISRRFEITPDLDDLEEEFFEAFQEFREDDVR